MRLFACYEEILKEKKRSLARHIARFNQVTFRDSVLLDMEDDSADNRPTVEWEVFSPYIFVCHAVLFVNFSFP
jgi:hypothetical protein